MLLFVPSNFLAVLLLEACVADFDTYSTAHHTGIMALETIQYHKQKS